MTAANKRQRLFSSVPVVEAAAQHFSVVVEDDASIRLLSVADSPPNSLAITPMTKFIS